MSLCHVYNKFLKKSDNLTPLFMLVVCDRVVFEFNLSVVTGFSIKMLIGGLLEPRKAC